MTEGHLRFGTDGVRGPANTELTPELALALGRAAAVVLDCPRWVVGRDTRLSGPMLEAALAAGLASQGVQVEMVGILPTPGVAQLADWDDAAAAVISASHNPWTDNGIKFFSRGGRKLSDDTEQRIEAVLSTLLVSDNSAPPPPREEENVGLIEHRSDAVDRYGSHLTAMLGDRDLRGLHVVLDCAHGAAGPVAGRVFESLGARTEVLNAASDGRDINAGCGSTDPRDLSRAVVAGGADLGLAFDGDADRLIAVAHDGSLVDGDHLMAMFAADMDLRGELVDHTLVVTVMSNLGLRLACEAAGITVITTPVGDRHVLDALAAGGYVLGGEQSGHIIFADRARTGDGILAGLLVADLVRRTGVPLRQLAERSMTASPQVLVNVEVDHRHPRIAEELAEEIRAAERTLGPRGRVLVRPSGTEPLIRVMVEAPTSQLAGEVADGLAGTVERRFGRRPPG
ncbi:MAG TPA: phosphoglucosamine mutase [Acidimicrobiales bacterium]|nr:phosphoglucosamine mutase [Acidimicrobiales bacterium]